MITKWFGSKVNAWVDMDDAMTNNFEVFVQGKTQTYLVHSRMKKNHKLFKEESPEHLAMVKKAIQDIIYGKEPELPAARRSKKDEDREKKEAEEAAKKKADEEAKKLAEEEEFRRRQAAEEEERETATQEAAKQEAEAAKKKVAAQKAKAKAKTKAKAKPKPKAETVAKEEKATLPAEADADVSTASGGSGGVVTPPNAEACLQEETGERAGAETSDPDEGSKGSTQQAAQEGLREDSKLHLSYTAEQKLDVGTGSSSATGTASALQPEANAAASAVTPSPPSNLDFPERTSSENFKGRAASQSAASKQNEPVQRGAESTFFGFFCCRSTREDDRLTDEDAPMQVVDADLSLD